MPVFQRYTWHIAKFAHECPYVTYRDRKGCCLILGSLGCGSLLAVLKFKVCDVWYFINYPEVFKRVWQQLLRQERVSYLKCLPAEPVKSV